MPSKSTGVCITSAALLSEYRWTNRYLPAPLRTRRAFAFAAHGLLLLALSFAVVRVIAGGRTTFLVSQAVFEVFLYIGLANSVVLTYQLLDRRYFPRLPKALRQPLIALCAAVLTSVAAIAVGGVVVGLFVIR